MAEHILELQEDLEKKLNDLFSLHDQPALFVSEYFFDLRNKIDYDAERTLIELQPRGDSKSRNLVVAINLKRNEFISFLKQLEEKVMSELTAITVKAHEVYISLKDRVSKFTGSGACDLNECEDIYAELAFDLMDERFKLERRLLGNQSIFYVSSEKSLGTLCHLSEVYLNKHEIKSIK